MPLIAGSVAAPIVGGIAGNLLAAGSEEEAKKALERARQDISGVNAPTVEQQQIALQKLASQGQLTPEMEQAIIQGQSQMAGISTDPRVRAAQEAALSSLQETGATGLNATDRAALQQIRNQNIQQTHANQQAILQNMQERGISGAGAELAAKLQANQAGAQEAQTQGLNVAGQAQARALQAIAGAGQLGSQMEGQQFGEKSDIARAADEIARFNVANQQNVQQRNVGSRNTAQAANLAEKQRIADQNAALANQQEMYNKQLYQQQFQNQLGKAGMLAGQDTNQYSANKANAAQTRQMWSNIGSGVGKGMGAGAQAQSAPKFDTSTGQALYNPQTGQQYQASAHGGMIEGYAQGGEVKDLGNSTEGLEAWDKNLAKLVSNLLHSKPKGYVDGGQVGPQHLLDNTDAEKRAKIAAMFGGSNPENKAHGGMANCYADGGETDSVATSMAFGGSADGGGGLYAEGGEVDPNQAEAEKYMNEVKYDPSKATKKLIPDMPGSFADGGVVDPALADKWKRFQQGFNSALGPNASPSPLPSPTPENKAFGGMNDEGGMWAGGVIPSMPNYSSGGAVSSNPSVYLGEYADGGITSLKSLADKGAFINASNPNTQAITAPTPDQHLNKGGDVQDYRKGGKVPGIAPFPGDNLKNDIVNAKLSPGEIVVPRSLVDKDHNTIASFVKAVKQKHDQRKLNPDRMPEERIPQGRQLNLKMKFPGVK